MKQVRIIPVVTLLGCFLSSIASAANDPAAAVVAVRKSCTENGVTLNNCFTTMGAVTGWMSTTRKPNVDNPLRVDIGPGLFESFDSEGTRKDITIKCSPSTGYTGYTTFEGSGSKQTILKGQGSHSTSAMNVSSCTAMNFAHLQITTGFYGGVKWSGGGNSNWNDVEILGNARAWYEEGCSSTRGKHYWFSSKLTATAVFGIAETYRSTCDESWFYGSEITVSTPANTYSATGGAILAFGDGIIHVYGSALRTFIDTDGLVPAAVAGYAGSQGGEIHIHGTGIDLTSTTGRDVVALSASNGGMIHADVTAFNPSTTGTVTRIANHGGHIHAPYIWQHIPNPAAISDFTSVDGADQTVVMVNGYPHTAIYSTQCKNADNTKAWYDTVDKVCLGQ